MSFHDEVAAELEALRDRGRLRVPRVVDGLAGPRARVDGRDVLNLSSNDYLSLAGDRRVASALRDALEEVAAGAGASRLIVGNHRLHEALEGALAAWLEVGGARLFGSGFAANVGTLGALLRAGDVVFSDELNHASVIDGCRLSRAEVVIYPHGDVAALEAELARRGGRRRLVVSETLFSMDGDIVDVAALAAVARRGGAVLMLDEAHAIGARGPQGRGIAAEAGVEPDVLVGTLGKAFGGYGAFVASSAAVAALLWNRARPLVFSTGTPPALARAGLAALEIIRGCEGDGRRRDLERNARALRRALGVAAGAATAITPVIVGEDARAVAASARLFERGILAQAIRPPTVPEGTARLRCSVASGHAPADVEAAAREITAAVAALG